MKRKTKLIATIMSICLVCAVFAIGVFALKTANLKIGGDVSFSATGVEADIKNVTLTGATNNDQVLATGSINTSMTQAEIDSKFQNWQTLKLDFDENATDIELKFDIANTSTNADNYIEIDYSYSFSNSSPNVDVFPGDENDQSVWKNNNYILAPKGATPAAGDYETFTLKFKVLDKELNVPQDTKVSINIALKHITPKSATATNNVVTIDNVQYTLNESAGTASVTGNTITAAGTSVDIHPVVKSNEEGSAPCVVTTIGDNVFYMCDGLAAITIPNSVTDIFACAFSTCENLNSVVIPNSVKYIGTSGFHSCTNLISLTIGCGVREVSDSVFENCSSLKTVKIPNGLPYIEEDMFASCTNLTSITIPNDITYIGNGAFSLCVNLTTITIPSSTTWIGGSSFWKCTSLTTIVIPRGVTIIYVDAFKDCDNLTSVKFEETTGWWYSDSWDATSGTELQISTNDFNANAKLLTETYYNNYWFRTV